MSGTDDPTHVYWDLENRRGLWARGEAMSETPQTEWLECPCCGEGVMGRTSPALWYQDEEEVCDCGCVVAASVDEHEDPPQAYAVVRKGCPEHGEVE